MGEKKKERKKKIILTALPRKQIESIDYYCTITEAIRDLIRIGMSNLNEVKAKRQDKESVNEKGKNKKGSKLSSANIDTDISYNNINNNFSCQLTNLTPCVFG